MTLGSVSATGSSAEGCFCSCCGAKMTPYFSDNGVVSQNQINQLISESFLTVKGAAVFLPRGNGSSPSSAPGISQRQNKHTGDLQQHLQTMFTVLRPEDNIRLAVRLESAYAQPQCTRYMVVVSNNGRQDTEESVVLGIDFGSSDSSCTMGLVLPLWSDTLIHLDGDGGFSVSTVNRVHVFKPVSVQAMWSALQSLHKACEVARCHNYYPGSLFLTWVSYYQSQVSSDQVCINEWNAMQDVQSHRADSPVLFTDVPTERERTERLVKTRLREIMMLKDLENVTSKEIRTELEIQMVCNLREFKEFIDNEMIVILGQMDSPTEIFDHVYLGSEWNASNLEELQNSGVRYILNVTREIDNFFPGMFEYHNIRVYDEEATNLLEYWNDTYKFITKAKKAGAKCLVHCKMGVSRSASTVIAYAMKEYGWDLERAFDYVKERRGVTKPNPSFMKQLEEYQGILLASKQRHNKLWRSHSDSDLSERHESLLCKTHPHNNNNGPTPSLQCFLLQALGAANDPDNKAEGSHISETHSEPVRLTRSHSHSPGPSASNSLCDSRENLSSRGRGPRQDPFLPPLPTPRVATVVPEERMDNSALAVVTVPITAVPHPPPSLHILPQPLAKSLHLGLSTQLSSPVPKQKAQSVALTLDLTDSIDFFSAREKFLGLSQDGRTRILSEQMAQRTPQPRCPSQELQPRCPSQELQPRSDIQTILSVPSLSQSSPHTEDGSDRSSHAKASPPPHHDNGVSVRHIVTEIESISHPPAATPLSSAQPAPRSPQQMCPDNQDEDTPLTSPSSYPQSPSTPPSDWPAGSVRRATKQLEQRLRQELDLPLGNTSTQRSPLHSPSAEFHPTRSPLQTTSTDCPPLLTPTTDCPPAPEQGRILNEAFTVSAEPKGDAELTRATEGGFVVLDMDVAPAPEPAFSHYPDACHTPEPIPIIVCPSLEPSRAQPQASPALLCLEGVTALESDTDGPSPPPPHHGRLALARSSEELEKIQETLRELQAFLYEAGGLGLGAGERPGQGQHPLQGLYHRETPVWQRAMEIEARIRQAGLTPPSLMKRSASLAKLDCLELSANDLSDWDLRPTTASPHGPPLVPTPHPRSHHHPSLEDVSKKQRVLSQSPPTTARAPLGGVYPLDPDRTDRGSQIAGSDPPSPSSPPSLVLQGEEELETDLSPQITRTQSPKSGKTHLLRRVRKAADKKRTATVLYNTM
uniref:protein-serine/threonine phosphatase n=1 Tax=Hucho hucho TaxID=62062 RepID=A0A4W5P9W7_9TELE